MNRVPEAIAAYRHALSVTPAFAHAHWNLALALLANGEYAEGWREYEWRLRLPELGARAPALPFARWDGSDLRDRTLLLIAEQGIGDALQFVRFAADVAARGAHVVVQAPAALARCWQPSRAWAKRCQPARPRRRVTWRFRCYRSAFCSTCALASWQASLTFAATRHFAPMRRGASTPFAVGEGQSESPGQARRII